MTREYLVEKIDLDFKEPEVNEQLAVSYGLSTEEYAKILDIMGREPTNTELGIFSVMWSEHCSYKSSRIHLKKLPTKAPWVVQGPGENAGVIDIGDEQVAVFKMESHNHPSFIEPYQGAATGVGGIMRDVFTMGARPVANLNALRFGDISHPKTKSLVSGVVAGIAGYGNCMGVPTVGGETQFDKSYNGNILVNAMTVGVADRDKIYYSRGAKPDMPVVYVGSKTGKDGIHGATMASSEFDDNSENNRPTVQVGDPFTEKLLLEACLELMQEDAIVCIQDMGAAGLTSSTVEIADKGEVGISMNLDAVPVREKNMAPYEIMLSESQERMLMVLEPGKERIAKQIFDKWDLDFAVIGHTLRERRLRITMYGRKWCDMPVAPLVNDAPVYDRPVSEEYLFVGTENVEIAENTDIADCLEKLISCPDMASKSRIWEQYDSLVMGNTVFSPGVTGTQNGKSSDAALVLVPSKENPNKAIAMSSDCNPHYCYADPFEGGIQSVAESYRNISACGATPLAITNNLNFGNPEKPEIMRQFVKAIEGMANASEFLCYPVVSGNVSLYNETNGNAILPTPVIGGVGVIKDYAKAMDISFKNEGDNIFVIGETNNHIGQSLFMREIIGKNAGTAPKVNLEQEKRNGEFIRACIDKGFINACHDISDGGLLCAVTEMLIASDERTDIGVDLSKASNDKKYIEAKSPAEYWFSEDQSRYVVTASASEKLIEFANSQGVSLTQIGTVIAEDSIIISDCASFISVSKLKELNRKGLSVI